jgi:MFS family permease
LAVSTDFRTEAGPAERQPLGRGGPLRAMGLVCSAHAVSHVYILALPPLFPLIKESLDVSYAALGMLVAALNISTGVLQMPAGAFVDRIGARVPLIVGVAFMAACIGAVGLVSSYQAALALMLLAGVGNAIVHPGDYAVMSRSIAQSWLGRAFAIHTFAGLAGFAAAPALMLTLASLFGWRGALLGAAAIGLAVCVAIAFVGAGLPERETVPESAARPGGPDGSRQVITFQIVAFFGFYMFSAMAMSGINSFGVAAMVERHGLSLGAANVVLTLFLSASAVGILAGGPVADRIRRHGLYAGLAIGIAALLVMIAGIAALPVVILAALLATAGFAQGSTRPSRDMMVRAVTPPGATGKVFGFVMTGLNAGGVVAPLVFGLLLDLGGSGWVFWLGGVFMLMAIGCVGLARQPGAPAAHPADIPTR